ncbi:MAG: AAA family ATPase, partial [bacterium]|nr:AAA family ATPase [bacterium]
DSKPCIFFEVTGLKDGSLKVQLELFTQAIEKTFYNGSVTLEKPKRWLDALKLLTDHLRDVPKNRKVVLFFDELPWLATRKSGILQAIDYTWNTQWSRDPRVKLIVCGSAASWILEKIIYAKGGLHNRITARIHLMPFNLKETQDYLKYRGIALNREQVLELYMVMGGIPYYLNSVS